jgi:phage terminase large subunit-like protein
MSANPFRQVIEHLWRCTGELVRRREANPIAWFRWLPIQLAYLMCLDRFRLLRLGNQVGKTTVALADLAMDAMGTHPYRPCRESGEYWVICASWSQSVAIQNKLHALLPPGRIKPGTVHSESRGYRGKNPAVEVRHEDGGWSIVRFKTTQQGGLNLAGATIRGALFDEPPASQSVYAEVVKRVQATGGWVAIAMTPINAPVDWIRELAAKKGITDLHSPLTPETMIPVGSNRPRQLPDGTICDADWIAAIEAQTPAHEIPVRIHGEWEVRVSDRYFAVFRSSGPDAHVHENAPEGEVLLCLGVDHGDRPGKQVVCLIAVDIHHPSGHPAVYIVDEYTDEGGTATPEVDARKVLDMLARHGLRWSDLHEAWGDRVHLPGSARQKSNKDLFAQIAKILRQPKDAIRPQLRTVKRGAGRGAGSVSVGSRWLYNAMATPGRFGVNPRCKRIIEALDRYTMADDEWKDPVDAIRYGLDSFVFNAWRRGPAAPVAFR